MPASPASRCTASTKDLQEADDVAVLAGREIMEEALVVIDEEGRRLLLGEGRQADVFTSLTLELHRPPDDVGRPKAGLQFFKEAIVEAHLRLIARDSPVWAHLPFVNQKGQSAAITA
jgi:hypothetical protein